MLSLQLCLSIAPLLAGSEAGKESLPALSLTIPYHLVAQSDGQLAATPVVLAIDDDDKKERDEHRKEKDVRRGRDNERESDTPKPESGAAEGRRPQPEGLRGRPELRRPDAPAKPPIEGGHRTPPDRKEPPHQGPPQPGKPPGSFRPPVMGRPDLFGMFGHTPPFNGGPGKLQGPPSGQGPGSSVLTGIIFELLDQNHDGTLSRGEFQKLADAVQKSHHPPILIPPNSGAGKGPDQDHGRPQLSRRSGPPMIHQPFPLLRHKPETTPHAVGEHGSKSEHRDHEEHHDEGGRGGGDRHRSAGERDKKSPDHEEPRI